MAKVNDPGRAESLIVPTLTDAQIAAVARQAGFTGETLVTAVAVALAESSGRTDVVNYLGCVGLWQIYSRVHLPRHPSWTVEWLKNPANNAQAAYTVWREAGGKWTPWSAYTNGAYRAYLSRARNAAGRDPSAGLPGVPKLPANPLPKLDKITNPENWKRAAMVVVGVICVLTALAWMSVTPQRIEFAKNAAQFLPIGRAGKALK